MVHGLANLAYLAGQLADGSRLYREVLKHAARHGQSETELEAAENYVSLITEQMCRAFARHDTRTAERRFGTAQRIARKYKLDESYRDLLLTAGESYWSLGARYYFSAARAYLGALAELPGDNLGEIARISSRIGVRVVLGFYRIPKSYPQDRVNALVARLEEWMRRDGANVLSAPSMAFLLWPFITGRKVAQMLREGKSLSGDIVGRMVAKDFASAVNALCTGSV